MKLAIKVIPNAKISLIKEEGGVCKVYVAAPAVDGKANKALILLLAQHFQVSKNRIEIIKGLTSQHKIINIK